MRAALRAARTRASAWRRRHPLGTTLVIILVAALALVIGDVGVMTVRLDDIAVAMPRTAVGTTPPDETWLVIGTDSRETVPEGPDRYGSVADTEGGTRADVLALVRPSASGTEVLVLPRDLTIGASFLDSQRLATSYLVGPQNTVDLLCTQLGVTTTHLVTVDMAQFATIIDSLGGLEVTIDEPVRDANAGLDVPQAGPRTLSGIDALALVRSRHPEIYRDGAWTPVSEDEGAHRRSHYTGVVMKALMESVRARARSPLAIQRFAWALSGNLGVDQGTGPLDLAGLGRAAAGDGRIALVDVPAPTQSGAFVAFPTEETYGVLAEHGYTRGSCVPAG